MMSDKEIIFSLECCCDRLRCSECYFAFEGGCDNKLKASVLELINRQQAEIEKARAEAIKEFADRLKDEINQAIYIYYNDAAGGYYLAENCIDEIDNLVKEMVGAENEA